MREWPSWAGGMALDRGPDDERVPSWRTRQGERVTIGDVVALSVLSFPDAVGRIVGVASDGRIECTLGDHDDPHGKRPRLRVEADNLLMLIRKG